MDNLTPKQRLVLDIIREFQHTKRYSPTISDLARILRCANSNAAKIRSALVRKGHLEVSPNGTILFPSEWLE